MCALLLRFVRLFFLLLLSFFWLLLLFAVVVFRLFFFNFNQPFPVSFRFLFYRVFVGQKSIPPYTPDNQRIERGNSVKFGGNQTSHPFFLSACAWKWVRNRRGVSHFFSQLFFLSLPPPPSMAPPSTSPEKGKIFFVHSVQN